MYFKKQEIAEKINQISQQRHTYDDKFSHLQNMINQHKKYEIVNLRKKFTSQIQQLQQIIKSNQTVIDLLTYRCQQLAKQGTDVNNQKIRAQYLKEYFIQLKEKLKRQNERGEQVITGRERWELIKYQGENPVQEEEQSLLNSHNTAKQTTQMARNVYESIANQSNRLENARQKMGNVIKNINFSGNIAQLLKKRTKQDNKLIAILSVGLVIWILVCLFILKPLYRGS